MAGIKLERITKKFGDVVAVDDLNLDVREPLLFLMDEPLSNLDAKLRVPRVASGNPFY